MTGKRRILAVDDEEKMRDLLSKVLTKEGYEVDTAQDGADALAKLDNEVYDLMITDLRMPAMDGMELLSQVSRQHEETAVILMTAFGSIESAVAAVKAGASDYIQKPFKMEEVLLTVSKALRDQDVRREVSALRREVKQTYRFDNIIGKSKPMQEVFDLIRRVARSKSTVLLLGKSGTGKELVAKAIHYNSARRNQPFVPVNCSAIPETLIESELFGHVRGAFTGAISTRKGMFEEAHTGTVFLDEIGDLTPAVQVKMLRVLQEREISRIGSRESLKVDIRLIAATNQDLRGAVEGGEFREDLYYRLNVISIYLPELNERREDIPLLVDHFLRKYAVETGQQIHGIRKEAMARLMDYPWPGNVRELENVVERAVILCHGDEIDLEDFPETISTGQPSPASRSYSDGEEGGTLEDLEVQHIRRVLQQTGGHQTRAAAILGIDRRTLYRKIRRYGIQLS